MSAASDLVDRVRYSRARHLAPGIGAALVTRNGATTAALGRRSAFARETVTTGDLWHIGSCTKAMTATLVGRLVDRGVTRFNATLAEALPRLAPKMYPGFRETTLRDVLTHSAGIARDPQKSTFSALRRSEGTARAHRRFLAEQGLKAMPRPGTGYSNLGYIVLGAVIEDLTGLSWENAFGREVMAPLGITQYGFGPPGEIGALLQPRGHKRVYGAWRVQTAAPNGDNPIAYGPAGRVHLSLDGWARFLRVHLNSGPSGFLTPATLTELHRPATNGFAMGWSVIEQDGEARLHHTGSNTAWFAQAAVIAQDRQGRWNRLQRLRPTARGGGDGIGGRAAQHPERHSALSLSKSRPMR